MGTTGGTRILTVNAGSTSVRLALFAPAAAGGARLMGERLPSSPGEEPAALRAFLERAGRPPDLVAHRVVHGGSLRSTRRFDSEVRQAIEAAAPLAPLHNPPTLAWAAAVERALPHVPALAVFDSAWFRDLPAAAATYGLPRELAAPLGLRRLGFHGLAHRSLWQALRDRAPDRCRRVISLQLGGGSSAAAVRDGQPLETSMGFSPLEGLLMATRPGDLDAGALLHLMEQQRLGPAEMRELLHRECGLRGISGSSGDLRQLLASPADNDRLAVDVYCHRVRKYLGAYLAVLGGCDAILVGGGAGEGSPALRERIFAGLEALGIVLDRQANASARAPARLGAAGAPVDLWLLATDEESLLAEEAAAWLEANVPAEQEDRT